MHESDENMTICSCSIARQGEKIARNEGTKLVAARQPSTHTPSIIHQDFVIVVAFDALKHRAVALGAYGENRLVSELPEA